MSVSVESFSRPQSRRPSQITRMAARWKSRKRAPGLSVAMAAVCASYTSSYACRCTALNRPDNGKVRVTSAV
jgi:hypothetical protein